MKRSLSILSLSLFVASASMAQTNVASDAEFFHPAASQFIQGDSTSSSNLVARGLSIEPDNAKLLRLKQLLEQQEQDKKDQEQQDEQDKKDQEEQDKKDQQEKDDQQKKDDQQQKDQDEKQDQEQKEQDQQEPQENGEENADQPPPQPPRPEQMTPDEAQQLLDAMKQEEKHKRSQLRPIHGSPIQVDKDW